MAGLDPFGDDLSEELNQPLVKKQEVDSILDDEKTLEEMKKLSEGIHSIDPNLADKIAVLVRKKQMLEIALEPIKKELENLRQLFLQQMLGSGKTSFRRTSGGVFSSVKKVYYSMKTGKDKVSLVIAVGRQDLLSVTASDFNKYCKEVEKLGNKLPPTVKKSQSYSLSVKGV